MLCQAADNVDEFDALILLIGAIFRQALEDTARGDEKALAFLRFQCADFMVLPALGAPVASPVGYFRPQPRRKPNCRGQSAATKTV